MTSKFTIDTDFGNLNVELKEGRSLTLGPTLKVIATYHVDGGVIPGDIIQRIMNPLHQYLTKQTLTPEEEKMEVSLDHIIIKFGPFQDNITRYLSSELTNELRFAGPTVKEFVNNSNWYEWVSPNEIPKITDTDFVNHIKVKKKRAETILKVLRKGTVDGVTYEIISPKIVVNLNSEQYKPWENVLHPHFLIRIFTDAIEFDGRPSGNPNETIVKIIDKFKSHGIELVSLNYRTKQ